MARKPIARKTAPKKRSRPKKKYGWRSEPYLRWVRSQPCVYCGRSPAGEAHHLIGVGSGLSGMGLTAPDQYVMPLCRRHHEQIHRDPDLLQHQWQWVAQTLARAVEEEVVTLVA